MMNRGGSASEGGEILRLRKELVHARQQVTDLQEELEEKTNLYIKAISDRDQYREKLNNAKESVNKVETIVQSKVDLALNKERMELARIRQENELLRQRIEMFDTEKLSSQQREKQLQDKINSLTQEVWQHARTPEQRNHQQQIARLHEEVSHKEAKITEHLELVNTLQRQLEDLATENRTLRSLTAVPNGYGMDLASIKLPAEKKIENYTKLIKVLQDDNYKLEEERARLKHMLKQQSMLYTNNQPWDRYPNLTPEELFKVDQYVLKLRAGEAEEPADFYKIKKENTLLKAQMEALNTKGFEFAKATIEAFLKEMGLSGEAGGKLFEKMQTGNEELKKMIRELMASNQGSQMIVIPGGGMGGGAQVPIKQGYDFGSGRFRPPAPSMGVDGDISSGYSYKFQSNMDVADKDGRAGLGDQTRYDVAFLQLLLQESFEVQKRKDEELQSKNLEVDALYKRIRDYLLVQDQLYKDFVKMEKEHTKTKEELAVKLRDATDKYYEEQTKVEKLTNLVQQLHSGVKKQSDQDRLIELTKQNSLLDVNLLRLTRKYQTLAEQEDLLRREYHNREADLGEKDKFVQLRINSLKEWKARAIQQLKFLFTKLRLAVPRTEYQSIQSENEVLKMRNADYIERNSKLAERVSKLQSQVRENLEAEERLRNLQEARDDLENEYEVVRQRLEQVDPQFKWENAIFNKVVVTLKKHRVSPQQVFDQFDKNGDGKLSRDEFVKALEGLRIADLSNQEIDLLLSAVDTDSSGFIQYKEFVKKLSRHGVKSRTGEEQILYLLIEALQKSKIRTLAEAFELFDKEHRGSLSKEDFKDVFKSMSVHIEEAEVDKFIEHFWRDQKAGIDYEAFLRIFQRYQLKLEDDNKNKGMGAVIRISDDVIRLKKRIFEQVRNAMATNKIRLETLFQKADIDGDNAVDLDELKQLFIKMKVDISDFEVRSIFQSMDFDMSGKITFPEFAADFNKTCETGITQLIQLEKDRYESEVHRNQYQRNFQQDQALTNQMSQAIPGLSKQNQEIQLQTKVAILETREKQLNRKLETATQILNHANQSQLVVQKQYDALEKRWHDLTALFHMDKQRIRELEDDLRQSIKSEEAKKLRTINEQLQTDLTETKAALLSYKNMNETISDQVKGLKLILERRKDENENLLNAVRELSSQSDEQKRLGKLYYLVMLSRWQEAALSRKYDALLNENREYRKELVNTEQLLQNKEIDHHRAENLLQEQLLLGEQYRKAIADSKNVFLALEKAEEFNQRLTEIQEEKTTLEEQYFLMRSKYRANQLTMDEALAKAENAQDLLETLQRSKQSDLSDRLISMSEKLQQIKLGEMRAARESNEVKEKNNYLSRLLRTSNEQVKKLEERCAEFESKMHKREEEFRRADNERMRRFFNARFDDIPAAFTQENVFSAPSARVRSEGVGGGRPSDNYHEPKNTNRSRNNAQRFEFKGDSQDSSSAALAIMSQHASNPGNNDSAKFLEGKLRKLEIELNKALDDIRAKDAIINRFKEWQLADKYLSEDEKLRDAIENQRTRVNAVHNQESQEMAEAAAQMVKTLQEMIDQKNEQLRSKEDQISRLREQMFNQSEQDGIEISKLRAQLTLAAGNALAKLQEIVVKHDHGHNSHPTHTSSTYRYENLTREELSRQVDEKDQIINKQVNEISGLEQQIIYLNKKNSDHIDKIDDLQSELDRLSQQNELKAKMKELDSLKHKLDEKAKKNEALNAVIEKLKDRITSYEIQKSDVSEDQKMAKLNEELEKKKHKEEINQMKSKLTMAENRKKNLEGELKESKVKEQQLTETNNKLSSERDKAQSDLRKAQELLSQEQRQREKLQIELAGAARNINNLRAGPSGQMTYEQLLAKVKELENDNVILKCQMKPVVVYNKERGTFEYISQSIPLINSNAGEGEQEINDIESLIESLKSWLARSENQSLTVASIFQSQDLQNFGEITEAKFETALKRIGVELRVKEKRLLKDALDPRNIGFMKYRPLLRELQGMPQIDFIAPEVLRLAKSVVEGRDLDEAQFKKLIDPTSIQMMTLQQLQESINHCHNEQFQMTPEEVEILFKKLTKCQRTIGITLSTNKLTDSVFKALDALLIERMRDSIAKSVRSLAELISKHDGNKDGSVEYNELENLFLDCQLAFKQQMFNRIAHKILDPNKRAGRVTTATLKYFLQADNLNGNAASVASSHLGASTTIPQKPANFDLEPSQDRGADTTPEELEFCRSGARKILQSFQSKIFEALSARDRFKEGLISREDLQRTIEEQKVPELTQPEMILLLKHADRGNKGYVCPEKFIERLQEFVVETKGEQSLRQFALACKRQSVSLKQELFKYDTSRNGRLDNRTFAKAMNQLPVNVPDDQIEQLFQAGEQQEGLGLDIKYFIDKVTAASKYNPLQVSALLQLQQPSGKQAKPQPGGGSGFDSWEIEKKYKTKLSALQQQIEESKKETQAVEKQARHWQEMANRLEKDKTLLQARLVDYNAKPPKAQQNESNQMAQVEQVQQLKDQVHYLQDENTKLDKLIQVNLKAEIAKQLRDNDRLTERNRHLSEDVKRLEQQVARILNRPEPMDALEKREEGELWRERRIQELEKAIQAREERENELNEQIFSNEEKLLDLKFQKETFDLQYARLQKRITDLEQYKLASSKYSSVLKAKEDLAQSEIAEKSGATAATLLGVAPQSKKDASGDSVKLKSKSSKSVSELEMLVESLKRVIEKQKAENEAIKKQVEQYEQRNEKLKSEKQLRQKIESLEQELHSYEMKDVNVSEKDRTIKKLIDANRQLKEELSREMERYSLLENKHKDILLKFNILAKENSKYQDLLFTQTTGGKMANFNSFLQADDPKSTGGNNLSKKFEDLY